MVQQKTEAFSLTILGAIEDKARALAEEVSKERRRLENAEAQIKNERTHLAAKTDSLEDCIRFLEQFKPLDNTSWAKELEIDL